MVRIRVTSAVVLPVVLGMWVGAGARELERELPLEAASLDPACVLDEPTGSIVTFSIVRDAVSG